MGRMSIIVHAGVWLAGAVWLGWLSLRAPVELTDGGVISTGPYVYGVLLALSCPAFALWYWRYPRMFRTPVHSYHAWEHLLCWLAGGSLIAVSPDLVWSVLNEIGGYQMANDSLRALQPVGLMLLAIGAYAWIRGAVLGARSLRG